MSSIERVDVTTVDTSIPIVTVEVTMTNISHRENEPGLLCNQIKFSA